MSVFNIFFFCKIIFNFIGIEHNEQEIDQDFDAIPYNLSQTKEILPLLEQFVPLLLESLNKKYDKVNKHLILILFYR